MKTYTESKGEENFDWFKKLQNPPETGSEAHQELIILAGSWVTCACGNQCEIIPRNEHGNPVDCG